VERSGNKPVVLQVVGEKDSGHPAPAALALQAIAVGESLAQRRREISQGTTFNGGMGRICTGLARGASATDRYGLAVGSQLLGRTVEPSAPPGLRAGEVFAGSKNETHLKGHQESVRQ